MTKNNGVEIKVGQVWRDDQRGQQGRTIRILRVFELPSGEHVEAELVTPTKWSADYHHDKTANVGRKTNLKVSNLRKNYTLVEQAPTGPSGDDQAHEAAGKKIARGLTLVDALAVLQERTAAGDFVTLRRWGAEGGWECTINTGSGRTGEAWLGDGPTVAEAIVNTLGYTGWTA